MIDVYLFSISILLFVMSLALVFVAWSKKTTTIPQKAAVGQETYQEIYLDEGQAALIGPQWSWTQDQDCYYQCPRCGCSIEALLRSYQHSSGKLVSLLVHDCGGSLETDPIVQTVGGSLC